MPVYGNGARSILLNPLLNGQFRGRVDGFTAVSDCRITLVALVSLIYRGGLHKATWVTFDLAAVGSNWGEFFRLGVPSALMLCMEWWQWEISTAMAGRLGAVPLAVSDSICMLHAAMTGLTGLLPFFF